MLDFNPPESLVHNCIISFLTSNWLKLTNALSLYLSYLPKCLKHKHILTVLLIINYCTLLFLSHTLIVWIYSCVVFSPHYVFNLFIVFLQYNFICKISCSAAS